MFDIVHNWQLTTKLVIYRFKPIKLEIESDQLPGISVEVERTFPAGRRSQFWLFYFGENVTKFRQNIQLYGGAIFDVCAHRIVN